MPAPARGLATAGDVLQNKGSRAITLERVELLNPSGMSIEEAYVIPMDETRAAVGAGSTEPQDAESAELWSKAVPLHSYELQPGQDANVVIAVSLDGSETGRADAMKIFYSLGNDRHIKETSVSLILANDQC